MITNLYMLYKTRIYIQTLPIKIDTNPDKHSRGNTEQYIQNTLYKRSRLRLCPFLKVMVMLWLNSDNSGKFNLRTYLRFWALHSPFENRGL